MNKENWKEKMEYYPEGRLKLRWFVDGQNRIQGLFQAWYPNGVLAKFCTIKEGEKNRQNSYILVPKKEQFEYQEKWLGVLIHEMAHSTCMVHERDSLSYAMEELQAELSSAYIMAKMGVGETIKQENAQYLKIWIETISSNPEIILDVTKHCAKSIDLISQHLLPEQTMLLEKNKQLYKHLQEQKICNRLGVAENQMEDLKLGKPILLKNISAYGMQQNAVYIVKDESCPTGIRCFQKNVSQVPKQTIRQNSRKP